MFYQFKWSIEGLADSVTEFMCAHRCGQKACFVMILNGQIARKKWQEAAIWGIIGGWLSLVIDIMSCFEVF